MIKYLKAITKALVKVLSSLILNMSLQSLYFRITYSLKCYIVGLTFSAVSHSLILALFQDPQSISCALSKFNLKIERDQIHMYKENKVAA